MSKKLSQEELRKLMREKRENSKSQIDSPFAKYSNTGQLSCSICNVAIKSNNLWVTHIVGKSHKENLLKLKNHSSAATKRSLDQPPVEKKMKTEVFKVPLEPPVAKPTEAANLADYSSSDDDDEGAVTISDKALPENFFDKVTNGAVPKAVPADSKIESVKKMKSSEILPEGFFDDPIMDAKARNIEYKDPIEEQWEEFKKSIAEETNVSNSIIEEDLQESTVEREIYMIDEEIHQWERKNKLEVLADNIKKKAAVGEQERMDTESDDENLSEDDLLDWRSKSVKKF